MKEILQDIVYHTHNLGFLNVVKVTSSNDETVIESMAEDKSVILNAKTHDPVKGFDGMFGMPNLNKLDIHLKCPEYKENAIINIVTQERNGEIVPTGIHFENENGDFQNDYRFMSQSVINEKLKTVKFKGATWDIEFSPSLASIQRLKFQSSAHSEESNFKVTTDNKNLIISFGDSSTHAGSFVFEAGIVGKLKHGWMWPVTQVLSILNLSGDKLVRIADAGALNITVDSGLAVYDYILPAQSK
jgi:hypothetical protein